MGDASSHEFSERKFDLVELKKEFPELDSIEGFQEEMRLRGEEAWKTFQDNCVQDTELAFKIYKGQLKKIAENYLHQIS